MMIKNNIVIENARLLFKNFSGVESKFNPIGRRNFCVVLDEKAACDLVEDGWNVKYLQPREEGDNPIPYLQVTLSYNNYPPKVVLISNGTKTMVDESSVNMLDWAEMENVDLIIRPYNYDVGGKSGVKACVKSMYITLVDDEFDSKYSEVPMHK